MARDTCPLWYPWNRTGRVIAGCTEVRVVEPFRDGPGQITLLMVLSTFHFIPLSPLHAHHRAFPYAQCPLLDSEEIFFSWKYACKISVSVNIILRMLRTRKASLHLLSGCFICQKFSWAQDLPPNIIRAVFLSSPHHLRFPPCSCTPSAALMVPCLLRIPCCFASACPCSLPFHPNLCNSE